MPLTQKDLAQVLGSNNTLIGSEEESEAKQKLMQYLKGTIGAKGKYQPGVEAEQQNLEDDRDQERIMKLRKALGKNGEDSDVGIKAGKLSITHGPNPGAADSANKRGEAHAIDQALNTYKSGKSKLDKPMQAAIEGLNSVNDPENTGSLGQARTLMLSSMGMNRYNENEAKAVLPPAIHGMVASLMNSVGGDESPLNETQKKVVNQFFKSRLESVKRQHDSLKQDSLNAASSSPFSTPSTSSRLSGLGKSMDDALEEAQQKYSNLQTTKGPDLSGATPPSIVSKLASMLNPKAAVAPTTAVPPTPKYDFNAEDKRRAAAKVSLGAKQEPGEDYAFGSK